MNRLKFSVMTVIVGFHHLMKPDLGSSGSGLVFAKKDPQ